MWGRACTIGWPRWWEKVVVQVRAGVQGNPGIHVSSGCCTEAQWQMVNTTNTGSSHSEGWTSEIKMPADLMSDENPLPGSQMVSPHCILTWRKGSLIQGQESCHEATTLWPPCLPKAQDLSVHSSKQMGLLTKCRGRSKRAQGWSKKCLRRITDDLSTNWDQFPGSSHANDTWTRWGTATQRVCVC